jgi:hypothetical protein
MTSFPTSGWTLAVDFGTSFTVAAVRVDGRPPETIEIAGERRVPSVVFVDDGGAMYVGRVAEDMAVGRPDRAVRAPKRRLAEPVPVVIGGQPYSVVDLVAAVLRHVYDEAVRHQGSVPRAVSLTHPATWNGPRRARLLEAATAAGMHDVELVPEPVAAARAYTSEAGVADGAHVAVYDLGGGTFDTTLLRAEPDGFALVGRPGGDGNLGGELFDELLVNLVGARLDPGVWHQLQASDEPSWRRAAAALHTEVRRAKEALSSAPYADVLLPLPGGMATQRVTRDELDAVVAPYVDESVGLLVQCVQDAGVDPSTLAAVHQVGGASRMPIVERALGAALPTVPVSRRGDPKTAVALGATLAHDATPVPIVPHGDAPTPLAPPSGSSAPPLPSTPAPAPAPDGATSPRRFVDGPRSAAAFVDGPARQTPAGAVRAASPWRRRTPLLVGAAAAMATLVAGSVVIAAARGDDSGGRAAATSTSVAVASATTSNQSGAGSPLAPSGSGSSTPATTRPAPPASTSPPSSAPAPVSAPTTAAPFTSSAPVTLFPPTSASLAPATAPPAGRGVATLTPEQAGVALLNLAEMTELTGLAPWSEGEFVSAGDLCGIPSPDPVVEMHRVGDYVASGNAVEVTSTTLAFDTAETAHAALDSVRQAVTTCPDPHQTQNGVTFDLSFTAPFDANLPGVDRTMVFGMLARLNGQVVVQSLVGVMVLGRAGAIVQYQVAGRNLDDVDNTRVQQLFARQAVKLLQYAA